MKRAVPAGSQASRSRRTSAGRFRSVRRRFRKIFEDVRASDAKHPEFGLFGCWQRAGPFAPGEKERSLGAKPHQLRRKPAQTRGRGDLGCDQELPPGENWTQQVFVVGIRLFGER